MDWVTENYKDLMLIVTGTVTVFSIVAKLTPSEWDDKLIGKILKIISINK